MNSRGEDVSLPVYVFSYNRGRYLRNCLASLVRHLPAGATVTVIDDGSTDPEVHSTLAEYSGACDAVIAGTESRMYLGGLYGNMQYALEHSTGADIALFIQDDMQVVRDIDNNDLEHWSRFFECYPQSMELYCCFIKEKQTTSRKQNIQIDHDVPVYFRDARTSRRAYFSAVGLFHVGRMRQAEWVFEASEGENNRRGGEHGAHMGVTPWPFMMWLPNAESAKFRRRGLLHRYAEWHAGVGFYPYRAMSEDQIASLRKRPLESLPVAESLLEPIGMDTKQPWLFEDATKAIKPIHRILKRVKKRQVARSRKQADHDR